MYQYIAAKQAVNEMEQVIKRVGLIVIPCCAHLIDSNLTWIITPLFFIFSIV